MPQLLKSTCLESVLRNKRSHRKEKPAHCSEDPTQPKINLKKKKKSICVLRTGDVCSLVLLINILYLF